jgi:general secretion pathway protein C
MLQVLLLAFAAYQGAGILYKEIRTTTSGSASGLLENAGTGLDPGEKSPPALDLENYDIITTRNLFKVLTHKQESFGQENLPDITDPSATQKTGPALALWGTVVSESPSGSYAVIENQATREQGLYQAGDTVADAMIKEILRNKVILSMDDQDQILAVDDSKRPSAPMNAMLALPETGEMPQPMFPHPLDDPAIESDPADMSALMKQVRVRPFFSNGQPVGILLYGIGNGSAFHDAGFRNGDIIQAVNGSPVSSPRDAQPVYQALQAGAGSQTIQVTLLRQGETMDIML